MNLIDASTFLIKSGIFLIIIHLFLEIISVSSIRRWLKNNKSLILSNEDINKKYENRVLLSSEYSQLKELHDENVFIIRKFSLVGLNYLDFIFFQGLIDEYGNGNVKRLNAEDENKFNKLKKLIYTMFIFEISMIVKKIGFFLLKFAIVYTIVLIFYKKIF